MKCGSSDKLLCLFCQRADRKPELQQEASPDLNTHEHQHSEHRTCTRAHSPETWGRDCISCVKLIVSGLQPPLFECR